MKRLAKMKLQKLLWRTCNTMQEICHSDFYTTKSCAAVTQKWHVCSYQCCFENENSIFET